MIAVIAGLASAIVFGLGDFVGGVASRRISAVRVVAVSVTVGMVLLLPLALLVPGEWSREAVLWGAASGVASALGLLLLYAALAIGPMSILSPLTAVLSAVVPVWFGLLAGDDLSPLALLGITIALVAVVMVGLVKERVATRPTPRGVGYAVGSGILIGFIIVFLDRAPAESGLIPLLFNRAVGSVILTAIVLVAALSGRRHGTPLSSGWRAGIHLAPICGIIDTIANSLILFALRTGELGITSVLIALYPAATIVLAAVVLHERLTPVQWAGLALALTAAAVLAVA